ncbi:hypothetical protein K402DRAFT_395563 [Aulographum hederae CBS 113979]|uniref:Serine-threonine protein kinase 19 n=1 Tax=Aulographum hederae CBS 113979 TaxID=1176131 RepID=A0A6G1GUT0_9PEZI|nr:hypothetical protein K402DRAFT_395563 [Aulographum hederae CBS 113979]
MSSGFQTRPAASSRVVKRTTSRSSSSPFASLRRQKSNASKASRKSSNDHTNSGDTTAQLPNLELLSFLPSSLSSADLVEVIRYIRQHAFAAIPERGAGMNSTRIAEVLNFRANLPPVVSLAHVFALRDSATATERGIAELVARGTMRRVLVPGRGAGGQAAGEGVVLVEDWEAAVMGSTALDAGIKHKYIALMKENPRTLSISASSFRPGELSQLSRCGFLTSTSAMSSNADIYSTPGHATTSSHSTLSYLSSSFAARAASGSFAAVGGVGAVHSSGGTGGGTLSQPLLSAEDRRDYLVSFSLPNMGSYLKLLTTARTHLAQLLNKASRFKEAPMSLLKERWDGNLADPDEAKSAGKKFKSEFGVLPGRTKKWKAFYGLEFEWVLEECLGGGMVECFETGSVGVGVKAA